MAAPGIGAALGEAFGRAGTAFEIFGTAVSWGTVLGGAVSIGGSLLLGALFPPPQPNLSQANGRFTSDAVSPTYSLSGGSNRARPFEPMPLLFGTHRIFPDYGARTYTEFEGEDQYLYQVFNFGLSDLALSDFRIGNTPLADFAGVEMETAGADGALTLFPANVDTVSGGALTYAAGWITRTSSIDATALAVDIGGTLYFTGDTGLEARSVTLEMEYRAVGSGTWLPFVGAASAVTLTSSSRKLLRLTYRKTIASGQYEMRIRRTTADETDARAASEIAWSQLRTYQPDTADYTGQKRVAVRIRASGQLQGQVEQLSAIGAASVPVWTGSAWSTQVSSNPAWLFLWFARGKKNGAGRRLFGPCLADSRIDIEGLKEWGAWCDAKGLSFDAVLDLNMSCSAALERIARCGRATMSWAPGKLSVVWDAAAQPVVAVFGMSNIKRRTFSVDWATEKLADEVVVNFVNPDRDWQQDTVRATVPGVTAPTNPANIELFGCKSHIMAGREANLLAANHLYRLRRVSFETDFEGMVANRGDVIAVSHDLTQWGYSGRLVAGSSTQLTLDRTVPFSPGEQHYVRVTWPNGWFDVLAVQYQLGESDTLTLSDAWPTVDAESNPLYAANSDPNHPPWDYKWQFEPKATPGRRLKIIGMEFPSHRDVKLTAMDDSDEYYLQEFNAYTYVAPGAGAAEIPTLSNLTISETLILVGTGYAVRLTLTFDISGPYEQAKVRIGLDGAPMADAGGTVTRRIETTVPDSGVANIELTAFSPQGKWGAASQAAVSYAIKGKDAPPSDVAEFAIEGDTLSWPSVPDADLAGYVIRWQPGNNRSWGDATPMHTGLLTQSPYTMINRPAGAVTIMIKSVDTSNNESVTAVAIVTDLGDPIVLNVVDTIDLKALAWPGTVSGGGIDGSGNLAATATGLLMWNPDDAAAMWWVYDSAPIWRTETYEAMTYETQIVPTTAVAGSRMTLTNAIEGDAWAIEYRRTGPGAMWGIDSEPMWSTDAALMWHVPGYVPWPGEVTARHEPYDIRVPTGFGATRGKIIALTPTFDVPDVIERLNDLSIAGAGTRLPIVKTYRVIKNVNLTLQAAAGGAMKAETQDKNATLGPLVKCFDAANAATTGKIDATIQGY